MAHREGGDPVICRRNIFTCVESERAAAGSSQKRGGRKIFFFFLWLLVDMRQPFRRICRWHSERRTFLGGKRMNKNDADSFANWHTPQNSGILFVFLIICLCELAAVTDRLVLLRITTTNLKITIDIYSTAVSSAHTFLT